MKLSTRARYGTRTLVDLALHVENGPVLLREIAERQEISLSYLEHLIAPLISAGIIKSARGPQGGVWLARQAGEIKLSEVVTLLEGSIAPVQCVSSPEKCRHSKSCVTRQLWSELHDAMNRTLESKTLQDLVQQHKNGEEKKLCTQVIE